MNTLFKIGTRLTRCSNNFALAARMNGQINRFYFASSTQELQKKIFDYLQKHDKLSKKQIELTSRFSELGLDSLERVELIAEMEEHLDITLQNELIDSIFTVTDAVAAFEKSQSN